MWIVDAINRGVTTKETMIKEVYQVTTSGGGTFEIITAPFFNSRHRAEIKQEVKNALNEALGLRLVKSLKYVGQVKEV